MTNYETTRHTGNKVYLIQEIPANDDFWIYFNENIYPMSAGQKLNFMNS